MLTVEDTRPFVQYTADGSQTEFTFPFAITDATDLVVTFDDGEAPTSHTVSGVGETDGGTVTFDSAPASGTRITLHRAVTIARTTDFVAGGAFRASAINAELDRLTMMLQDLGVRADTAVRRAPFDVDGPDLVLPDTAARAASVLAFDANGAVTALPDLKQRAETAIAKADEAEQSATDAANSADAAATSASTAQSSADSAATSASNADTDAANAADSASTADTSATNAAQSASDAGASATTAHAWAEEAEDVEVASGEFSAHHWAKKAAAELPSERTRADLAIQRTRWGLAVPSVAAVPAFALDFPNELGLDHVSVTRASEGTYRAPDGAIRTAGTDTLRLDHDPATGAPLGALVEPERTNLLHDSFAPADQTRTLAAGTYTVSLVGSGSVDLSGGATGTASEGAPVTFTLDAQADVTFAVSGTVTAFQCEAGTLPTSPIATPSGGTATRAADDVHVTNLGWLNGDGGSVVVQAHLPVVSSNDAQRLLTLESDEPDRHNLFWNGANTRALLFAKAGGSSQGIVSGLIDGWADGETHTLGFTFGTGDRRLFADGTKEADDTIAAPATPTLMRLGSFHAGGYWTGQIARIAVYNRVLSDAQMTALTG